MHIILYRVYQRYLVTKIFRKDWPWRKYRIEIYSKSIRTIPIHSDICIRANSNHSEPIRKTFCISFDEKTVKNKSDLIRFNRMQLSEGIRTNTKLSFQTEFSIRINPRSEWFGLILIENSVWINPGSNSFGLKT